MNVVPLLILMVLSLPAFARQGAPVNEKDLKRQRQRAQAVSMVEQVASEAPLWDDKKSAVEALAGAADLLWDQSPGPAAKWLTKAWDLIDQVSESQPNEWTKQFVNPSQRSELRGTVLRVAHAHDAKLADRFINQLEKKEPEEKKDRGAFDDRTARSEQFLKLAQQAVDTNPELAFSLAQRSLVDGLSFTLQNVLTRLRKKSVELSNRLFDLAMARLGSSAPEPSEAEVLAAYLFRPGTIFSTNPAGVVIVSVNPVQKNEPPVVETEPRRARDFLVLVYQTFFTQPPSLETPEGLQRAQRVLMFGNRIIGRYNTLAPEFAVPAKAFLTQLQTQAFPAGRVDPFSSNGQSSTPDGTTTRTRTDREVYEERIAGLEERADKAVDPRAKRLAYIEAALACDASDYERAKRIVEKIPDESFRDDAIAYVIYRAALSQAKDSEKALALVSHLNHIPRRSVVKIAIAQNLLANKNDEKTEEELKVNQQIVFDLLGSVERDLRKEVPSANAARVLLGRAALLTQLDSVQALIALEQAMQTINKVERFDLNDMSAPKLGLNGSPRSEALLDLPRIGFSFRSSVEPIITDEFVNIVNLADSLTAKEVRGVARLEIAKLYLQKNK